MGGRLPVRPHPSAVVKEPAGQLVNKMCKSGEHKASYSRLTGIRVPRMLFCPPLGGGEKANNTPQYVDRRVLSFEEASFKGCPGVEMV